MSRLGWTTRPPIPGISIRAILKTLGWFGDPETAGGPLGKKLASWTLFLLFADLVFFTMPRLVSKNHTSTVQANAPVAQTGRWVEPAQAVNILPAYQQTFQTAQQAPSFPTLRPQRLQKPDGGLLQTTAAPDRFQRFIETVKDGEAGVLRGVYVDGVLALTVIQQPKNDDLYVSTEHGIATQFQNAAKFGVTGLLAHNFLSGELFYQLKPGQKVQLVYGDGKVTHYLVTDSQRYQKLEPNNSRSRYIELSTGKEKSTDQVFSRFYTGKDRLVFQTCLKNGDEWSWGLTFVIAVPIN